MKSKWRARVDRLRGKYRGKGLLKALADERMIELEHDVRKFARWDKRRQR